MARTAGTAGTANTASTASTASTTGTVGTTGTAGTVGTTGTAGTAGTAEGWHDRGVGRHGREMTGPGASCGGGPYRQRFDRHRTAGT